MDGHIEQIRRRAYELWIEGGMAEGQDRDHWHRAEHELTMRHEHASPKARSQSRPAAPKAAAKPALRTPALRKPTPRKKIASS